MADTLDLLTLAEGKTAINMAAANTDHDTTLARHITAISRIIDGACGPVVVRTVTNEVHPSGTRTVNLRRWPVTSITTVNEVRSGAVTALTALTFGGTGNGFYAPPLERDPTLLSGRLYRQQSSAEYAWGPTQITYVAGRYANTAAVDARFKDAAGAVLRRLWKREAGAWAQSTAFYEDADPTAGSGFFRVARPIIEELLWDEMQTNLVGFA